MRRFLLGGSHTGFKRVQSLLEAASGPRFPFTAAVGRESHRPSSFCLLSTHVPRSVPRPEAAILAALDPRRRHVRGKSACGCELSAKAIGKRPTPINGPLQRTNKENING